MSKLILTSYGLTSKVSRELIFKELKKDEYYASIEPRVRYSQSQGSDTTEPLTFA